MSISHKHTRIRYHFNQIVIAGVRIDLESKVSLFCSSSQVVLPPPNTQVEKVGVGSVSSNNQIS